MKPIVNNQEVWRRELAFARQGKFWRAFACELRNCAEYLEQRVIEDMRASAAGKGASLPAFFSPKFARMLLGLSLENLVKGLLLSSANVSDYVRAGKRPQISFGKRGHDLEWLLRKAGIEFEAQPIEVPTELQGIVHTVSTSLYLRVWSTSATWFGKYPYPLDVGGVLTEYQGLKSSKALLRRRLAGKRAVTDSDILHTGIGDREWREFHRLFELIEARYPPRRPAEAK
jgi:hypothetical protein